MVRYVIESFNYKQGVYAAKRCAIRPFGRERVSSTSNFSGGEGREFRSPHGCLWHVVEIRVESAAAQKFIMRTLVFDYAMVENEDPVYPIEGRNPVGDKNDRLILEVLGEIRKDPSF